MNPIVHFEMPYRDQDRLCKFYASAFGWEMNKTGPEMGDYVVATTTETDEKRMVKTPGTINGGFFPKQQNGPQYPSVVVAVDDIKKATSKIIRAGGKVMGEPVEIPGIGLYVSFDDTEGNRASILQPLKR
jgi:predicted enzyme related to lactoylglutathione lyase